jgi:Mlc titration factor MtfA (ptsG expression regulator)
MPKATELLAKPLSRQANKPFTPALDPDYNPRTVCRADVANISGWNRLTTNVIGRSAIDSIYMNRTSSPGYMNPYNAIKPANQFNVMSETLNMTHPGSYLQQRMWAL